MYNRNILTYCRINITQCKTLLYAFEIIGMPNVGRNLYKNKAIFTTFTSMYNTCTSFKISLFFWRSSVKSVICLLRNLIPPIFLIFWAMSIKDWGTSCLSEKSSKAAGKFSEANVLKYHMQSKNFMQQSQSSYPHEVT